MFSLDEPTDEDLHKMGLTRQDYEEIERRNMEVIKKRGELLPKTQEELDEFISSMPLLSPHIPDKKSVEFEALETLIGETTPVERAENFKNSGNTAFNLAKKGKKYAFRYKDAETYYTQALDVNCDDDKLNSVIHSNRALVHFTVGNVGKCVADCVEAIRKDPTNIKAYHRMAKGLLTLEKLQECEKVIIAGLARVKDEEQRKALIEVQQQCAKQLQAAKEKHMQQYQQKMNKEKAEQQRKDGVGNAIKDRGVTMGELGFGNMDHPASGYDAKPFVDSNGVLHWPVLFLYPEHMQSDFVQDFSEDHTFDDHLSQMFPPATLSPPWDEEKKYTLNRLKLFYEDAQGKSYPVKRSSTLKSILCKSKYVVPGIPTFHILV